MHITVITLFPEMLKAVTDYGISGRAVTDGKLIVDAINPREFTHDRHQTVDDRPFGGGPGMVMKVEPLLAAIDKAKVQLSKAKVIYLSPQGEPLAQQKVVELASAEQLILLAGRYEGIDERVVEARVDEVISIGDYVLSGGELPALVLTDAIARCLPGALGHEQSAEMDSFSGELAYLLDCPHYTRPEEFDGRGVPEVLLSGHHGEIARWRLQQSLGRTWRFRPDLLAQRREMTGLSDEEESLLADYMREYARKVDEQR
jgi:tRNA (guanine37-N1)-methyltransferase